MKWIPLIMAVALAGCDNTAEPSSIPTNNISTRCLDGVEYYLYREKEGTEHKGYGYMAAKFDRTGNIVLCYNDSTGENNEVDNR